MTNAYSKRWPRYALTACLALAAACGSDEEEETCDPIAQTGCEGGQVCEVVRDGEPGCFEPVVVRGRVFDLADDVGIGDARVVALDVNNAPVSSVAVTDGDGTYELGIPSTRDAEGNPDAIELTLRADAAAYQSFPSGLRQALPIDTASAELVPDDAYVIELSLTDIGLIALPEGAGTGSISGTAEVPPDGAGVLVVAEDSGGVGHVAIADRDGDYRIFNLDPGDYDVTGYARGVNYASVIATVNGDAEADLAIDERAPGAVSGTVQIVNAPGELTTSVILAVESTFDDVFGRGAVPPGMRAPDPGVAANIAGEYLLEGVPAGRYVVLAAFENDQLVRDPDLSISGTATLHIEVAAGETTVVEGFKITEALEVFGPGAVAAEAVTGPPTLSWKDDSSEDQYNVVVFDAFGEAIWDTSIDGVSGSDPSVVYEGPDLEPGMFYQFRATSLKDGTPLSATEDLKGVFFME